MSFVLLLVLGCSDYGVTGKPALEVEAAPRIRVDPPSVDFGALPIGSSSDLSLVGVFNDGDADLELQPLALIEADAPFTLTALGDMVIEPGASTTFAVGFTAEGAGEARAEIIVRSNDLLNPELSVLLRGEGQLGEEEPAGKLRIDPAWHDFGTLDHLATDSFSLSLHNDGDGDLSIDALSYGTTGSELSFDADYGLNGALPWVLAPGEMISTRVSYAPTDDASDSGTLTVQSDDPDQPVATATQVGNARAWEGFSTGWYIVDDSTNYETTSNPSYRVVSHGDLAGYWYEPSGAHGMVDSADVAGDFATLRDYIVARAGAPTPVTGPMSFYTSSTVPSLTYASYSYVLCDFWLDTSDDPALYEITTGTVDDGILVIVNGEILGSAVLGSGGRWTLDHAVAGAVNSLVVILMDNAAVDKYVNDLAFYRDGVMVTGG